MTLKQKSKDLRIAWLVPSSSTGAYFGPIIHACTKVFKETIFYTGQTWPDFSLQDPGASQVKIVGKTEFMESTKVDVGYNQGFFLVSPKIIIHLFQYKPDVIIASAFSLWTLIALVLKPLHQWKIIVVYDGFSPNTSYNPTGTRSSIRRLMSKSIDTFIANNYGAEQYLKEVLNVPESKICNYPYLVPDSQSLLMKSGPIELGSQLNSQLTRPIFICVGQIVNRKGIRTLFEACSLLKQQGCHNFTLLVVGDGSQRQELEAFAKEEELEGHIIWTGWIEYRRLGGYFQLADVFVFPSYEDVWGMVVLEAMAFSKPILCSKWAGAVEMVKEGENGYAFDPHEPKKLAELMKHYIDQPELIQKMGDQSKEIISKYSPETTAQVIGDLSEALLNANK